MAFWTIRLLGGLSAQNGERVINRFRTRKTGALLAYLAFHRDYAAPREHLLEVLWPESDLSAARNSLSVALSSLRAQLEPPLATPGTSPLGEVLRADRNTVYLHPDAFSTDVAAFETALHHTPKAENATSAASALKEALAHYHGELLPGFFDDWIFPERQRLHDLYGRALCQRAAHLMETGAFSEALETAHRAASHDPLGEEAACLLMRVYAHLGQPAAVRAQMSALENRRKAAGDAPPRPETYWLAQRLSENTDPDKIVLAAFSPVSPPPVPPAQATATAVVAAANAETVPPLQTPPVANLPLPLSRFFGQENELQRLHDLLAHEKLPLITLTGPGGSGKTRLALETARRFAATGGADKREVCFVPLADVTEAAFIPQAICDALFLPRSKAANATADDALEQLVQHWGGDDGLVLLVLDNMEHLQTGGPLYEGGAAHWVRRLLARLPSHVRLLVTSRHILELEQETEYPVPLLATPPDCDTTLSPGELLQFSSVQLFVDRAQNRRVHFQVTPHNAGAVARLMGRLEGIPLAIELCAAWSRLLSPAQMEERLTQRFALLVSQGRGAAHLPERQRTLWNTLQWGYDLLSPDARRVFAALSVFRGDFSVAAAESICDTAEGRTVEGLTLLQNASLLVTSEGDEAIRLRLLETVREFADAQLTDAQRKQAEEKHAAYYLARADEAHQHWQDVLQKTWFDRLEADMPNFRVVLQRFADEEIGVRLCADLGYFWKIRGYYREGRAWLKQVLSSPAALAAADIVQNDAANAAAALDPVYGRVWGVAGYLAEDMGDYEEAVSFYQKSIALFRAQNDAVRLAPALNNLGNIAYRQTDYQAARALYEEALRLHQSRDDTRGRASALGSLGNVAQSVGDYAEAHRLHEESLRLSRDMGDDRMTASTLHNLGNLAQNEGDPARARVFYEQSLPLKQALGDRRGVATLQTSLGFLALQGKQIKTAAALFVEALRVLRELQNQLYMIVTLEGLAWCAMENRRFLHAARLFSAAQSARARLSMPYEDDERAAYEPLILQARTAETAAAFEQAWADGSRMSLDEAADCALSHAD